MAVLGFFIYDSHFHALVFGFWFWNGHGFLLQWGWQEYCMVRKVRLLREIKASQHGLLGKEKISNLVPGMKYLVFRLIRFLKESMVELAARWNWILLQIPKAIYKWNFHRTMNVPLSSLHSKGYIFNFHWCTCTRPVLPGQYEREVFGGGWRMAKLRSMVSTKEI